MTTAKLTTLFHLLRGQQRHGSHAQRLQAFYAPQAKAYDNFRERLLHGRRELAERVMAGLPTPAGATLVELGAGTGRNIEFFGANLACFGQITLVDLCPALLEIARQRTRDRPNVRVIEADALCFRPDQAVDAVIFSYSLTMIPDWKSAIANALAMLKPGGILGVVDFTVSPRQSGFARHWWKTWFSHDGVHLSQEHVKVLRQQLPDHYYVEQRASLPYLPGLSVPYYLFVGPKP